MTGNLRFNFRAKLTAIAGTAALGFLVLIITNVLIVQRVKTQLSTIHGKYIPMMELGPHLETQFGQIIRGLQDSVASHDVEGLQNTRALNREFLDDLGKTSGFIEPESLSSLRAAEEDYFSTAFDVSHRLMAGETGVAIVNSMTLMKDKYTLTKKLLQEAVVFDKSKLADAFEAANQAMDTAAKSQLYISVSCLFFVMLLSLWISRGVLFSLHELTEGLSRFSQGEFSRPIPVTSRDELGDVAREANQMASQIQALLTKLAATNKELEAFSYSVAHDLRSPLRASLGFSDALLEDYSAVLPPEAQQMLKRVANASKKMGELIDGLLSLSRIARNEMTSEAVDLSSIADTVLATLQQNDPERKVITAVEKGIIVRGDPRLLHAVLANLIGNAWKFTNKKSEAKIEFGSYVENGKTVYFVRDNGAGFDMAHSEKLFGTFQRLHAATEFEGTGIGLATVQRIIHRHDGKIWAKSERGNGATFSFSLC